MFLMIRLRKEMFVNRYLIDCLKFYNDQNLTFFLNSNEPFLDF